VPSQSDLEFWSENRLVNKISRAKAALSLCLAVVGACAVGVSSARAQTAAGEITGLVKDQAGAAVTGATITVTETRTNLQRVVVSTRDGVYTVASLVPGEYRLDIALAGFKSVRREGVRLATGEKARIDFDLAVGSLQEQITVVGDAPIVRAETASLGTVVENGYVKFEIQRQRCDRLGDVAGTGDPEGTWRGNRFLIEPFPIFFALHARDAEILFHPPGERLIALGQPAPNFASLGGMRQDQPVDLPSTD